MKAFDRSKNGLLNTIWNGWISMFDGLLTKDYYRRTPKCSFNLQHTCNLITEVRLSNPNLYPSIETFWYGFFAGKYLLAGPWTFSSKLNHQFKLIILNIISINLQRIIHNIESWHIFVCSKKVLIQSSAADQKWNMRNCDTLRL